MSARISAAEFRAKKLPKAKRRKPEDCEALFWSHVDKSGGDEACWPWLLSKDGHGYGKACVRIDELQHPERAHRVAFFFANGYLPKGKTKASKIIRHKCNNPPCCNPSHLRTGSQKDNMADCREAGRFSAPPTFHKEGHPRAKLTMSDARAIRKAASNGNTVVSLARHYNVGETTVWHVIKGDTWQENLP